MEFGGVAAGVRGGSVRKPDWANDLGFPLTGVGTYLIANRVVSNQNFKFGFACLGGFVRSVQCVAPWTAG